jgi:selenocysteine lyase/cysteine desulfurase
MSDITVYSGPYEKTPCIIFNKKDKSSSFVSSALSDEKICVRSGFHCAPLAHQAIGTSDDGAVRVSLSHNNSIREIEKFLKVLKKI